MPAWEHHSPICVSSFQPPQVVAKSSNPKYAASFPLQYELGSQMLVFVDVFAVRSSSGSFMSASLGSIVSKRGMKLLGRAVYDIQDVLGTGDNVKARRLRNGGVYVTASCCILHFDYFCLEFHACH